MKHRKTACPLLALMIIGVATARAASDVHDGPHPSPTTKPAARQAPEWNAHFEGNSGWIGGDAVYSVELPDHRILWFFGDSLIGTVRNGRRSDTVMVNNAVALQTGPAADAPFRFVIGGNAEKPASLIMPTEGGGWFWPQGVIAVGKKLFLFLPQIQKTSDPGAFGFRQTAQWLGVIDNPGDDPRQWRMNQHKGPSAAFTPEQDRSFGSALLADGADVYIYGYLDDKKGMGSKQLIVARAPLERMDDFSLWRFRTADGWSASAADAVALATNLAAEFSVTRAPGGAGFVLVYTENGLSDRIVARFAPAPEGPWSAPTLLYVCPEMAADKGLFTYSAKAHPWAGGDELLISYCVNAWKFERLFADEKVYRPKFVRVKFMKP